MNKTQEIKKKLETKQQKKKNNWDRRSCTELIVCVRARLCAHDDEIRSRLSRRMICSLGIIIG